MGKKLYHVFVIDVWNNISEIGHFTDLADAVPQINGMISNEKWHLDTDDLKEYPSTFGSVFDTMLSDVVYSKGLSEEELQEFEDSEDVNLQIRGFIYDLDDFKKYINDIK